MKSLILYLIGGLIVVSLSSCNKNKNTPPQHINISDINNKQEISESDRIANERQRQYEIDYMDTTAIGNIHLNTTKDVFEQEKRQFLAETPSLGELRIKSVTGFFYDNRLSAVQIISYPQTAHKEGKAIYGTSGWEYMYYQKYGNKYSSNRGRFQFVKGRKGMRVTDFCASDRPYNSFKELMEQPLKACYQDEALFPAVRMEGNVDGMMRVADVLQKLPGSRANYYQQQLNDALSSRDRNNPFDISTPIYQRIYDAARVEANQIIQQRNEVNSNKHKNDPSWSVIIIGFIPACDKYNEEKRLEKERKQQEKQNDLDKI